MAAGRRARAPSSGHRIVKSSLGRRLWTVVGPESGGHARFERELSTDLVPSARSQPGIDPCSCVSVAACVIWQFGPSDAGASHRGSTPWGSEPGVPCCSACPWTRGSARRVPNSAGSAVRRGPAGSSAPGRRESTRSGPTSAWPRPRTVHLGEKCRPICAEQHPHRYLAKTGPAPARIFSNTNRGSPTAGIGPIDPRMGATDRVVVHEGWSLRPSARPSRRRL